MHKIYYDHDADLNCIKDKTIGIIGYGIQGRAQALNLRDSGLTVFVANRNDSYEHEALEDGFRVYPLSDIAENSDLLMLLIPDQAHAEVFKTFLKSKLKPGTLFIVAHGFSLYFKTFDCPDNIDVAMLAPRMPGQQIRESYLKGGGIPAFVDVIQNKTDLALPRILGLAKGAGFTRAGVLEVNYRVETELDLFVEQFLIPNIIKTIDIGFRTLVDEFQFPPVATLMELYASGELAEVLKMAAEMGIGQAFEKNASPTCQFGIASRFDSALEKNPYEQAKGVMRDIRNQTFKNALEEEAKIDYQTVKKLWQEVNHPSLLEAHHHISSLFKKTP